MSHQPQITNLGPIAPNHAINLKSARPDFVVQHAFGGWHHVGERKPCGAGVMFSFFGGDVATWDFDTMTRLVLASHAVRVRASVGNGGPRMLRIMLHPRVDQPDSWSKHHPSLDDLIALANKLKAEVRT